MTRLLGSTLVALVSVAVSIGCQDVADVARNRGAVTDLSGGVVAANHPAGAGAYGVWYDATHNTFGTPSAATLDGAPGMRIDDGGFTNGVYAVFESAIPASGTYRVEVPMWVVESSATGTGGIRAYQVGVAVGVGAAHRGLNPSALPGISTTGSYAGLTSGDDSGLGTSTVATGEFAAAAGDDVLIAFGTDVASGAWNQNSGFWSGGYVLVGSPRLVPVHVDPSIVVDDDDGAPAFAQTGAWTTSGSPGYEGGVYRFASAGAASTATWTATLDPGFYDVDVTYRAGTNRTDSASYTVESSDGVLLRRLIDQRYRDLSWVRLGLVEVTTAGHVSVTLDASSAPSGAVVIADAIRFLPSDGPPPVDAPEVRMATVTVFDTVDDVGALQVLVDELAALHYNSVAVHTRYRGDATYVPNRIDATYPNQEPRSPLAGDVDVLAEMVERGHRAGLKVFAYVNTHLVTDGADTAASPDHVVNSHPEWRTYAYNGGAPVVQDTSHDPEGLWLDPALPSVRGYLSDIVGDIATNYDVDGVVLDRIRYPQTSFTRENRDFGYHPDAVRRFNIRYRTHGTPDPRDPNWITFRQEAVTDTVGAIYDRLVEIDPSLLLLAFPIGRFNDAVNFNYQDWPSWLTRHRIDGVLPQIYTTDTVAFRDRLREHLAAYGGDRILAVTVNAFQTGVDLEAQTEEARVEGFDGTSPFRHGTMESLGYIEPLRGAWDGVAAFPETPWKGISTLTLLHIEDTCGGDASSRTWSVENDNVESIAYEWRILEGGLSGSGVATPGTSMFSTTRERPFEPMMVRWYDYSGRARRRLARPCLGRRGR